MKFTGGDSFNESLSQYLKPSDSTSKFFYELNRNAT